MTWLRKRPGLKTLLFLFPGIGFLLVLFGFPLFEALLGSVGLTEGLSAFTLEHYAVFATRAVMWRGFTTSIYYGVAPVVVTLVLSIGLAMLLRKHFLGRKLFNGLYKIPMAVPAIITSLMVLTLFEQGGFIDRLLLPLGLQLPKMVRDQWGVGVILATTWKQLPFMTLVITGAFAAIQEDMRHAARSLGASPVSAFLFIELPLAMPGITAAVLLTFIGSMGSFAIPDLIGAPNPSALSVLMVRAFSQGNIPQVYAIGMVLSAFAVAALLLYYALTSGASANARHADD